MVMVCVRNKETNEVRRVSEVQATNLVISGPWMYAKKSLWKAQRAGGKNKVKNRESPTEHPAKSDEPARSGREVSGVDR